MVWIAPDYERLSQLNVEGLHIGDQIIFCPDCDFQKVNVGMRPECPICGCRLHVTRYEEPWLDRS